MPKFLVEQSHMVTSGLGRFVTNWMVCFLDLVIYFPEFCRISMSSLPSSIGSGMGMDVHFNIFGILGLNS